MLSTPWLGVLCLTVAACGAESNQQPDSTPPTPEEALALRAEMKQAYAEHAPVPRQFQSRQDEYFRLLAAGKLEPRQVVPLLRDLLSCLDELDPLAERIRQLNARTGSEALTQSWLPALKNNAARRQEISEILARLTPPR